MLNWHELFSADQVNGNQSIEYEVEDLKVSPNRFKVGESEPFGTVNDEYECVKDAKEIEDSECLCYLVLPFTFGRNSNRSIILSVVWCDCKEEHNELNDVDWKSPNQNHPSVVFVHELSDEDSRLTFEDVGVLWG